VHVRKKLSSGINITHSSNGCNTSSTNSPRSNRSKYNNYNDIKLCTTNSGCSLSTNGNLSRPNCNLSRPNCNLSRPNCNVSCPLCCHWDTSRCYLFLCTTTAYDVVCVFKSGIRIECFHFIISFCLKFWVTRSERFQFSQELCLLTVRMRTVV